MACVHCVLYTIAVTNREMIAALYVYVMQA